jgi:predicted N-formylglutamate amidohydrolase
MSIVTLLRDDEPAPASIDRAEGASPFLIVCDHAGRRIPAALGTLGLGGAEQGRHIAWDIGAGGVSDGLGERLGAEVIKQAYSRLVIDCNRAPGHATSIAKVSEATVIPGNAAVTAGAARQREDEIFRPYHGLIAARIAARQAAGRRTVLVAVHSFTPVYHGVARPWHAGVLYDRDPVFSREVLRLLRTQAGLVVGENEPYRLSQDSDYTVPVHGEGNGLACVELEIRQDLIASAEGQRKWTEILAPVLEEALAVCAGNSEVSAARAD